jgi:acetoin utilization protein AcuB
MIMKKYKKIPQVGSVMTTFPYFVNSDDTIAEVERLMDEHQIRHVPVQQDGRVVGIISERDIYRLLERFLPQPQKEQIRARDIMIADPYVVSFEAPLNEIALEMAKRHIGSVIVLHHQKLAGIVSATDICRILAEIFEAEFSDSTGDDVA